MLTTLLIDRGDLPSLAALVQESDHASIAIWHENERDEAAARRRQCVELHAHLFGIPRLLAVPAREPAPGEPELSPEFEQTRRLIRAAMAAAELGCRRLVWPHQVRDGLKAMGSTVERSDFVAALIALDARLDLLMDLPVMDLSDPQLAELVDASGVPGHAFWPCEGAGELPCGECHACRRWQAAFESAELDWPWQEVAAGR